MWKTWLALILTALLLLPLCAMAEDDDTLYPIRENGLWGYMNRQGETVIEPQWEYAGLFQQGVALVGREDREEWPSDFFGLLRSDGTMILPAEYMICEYTSGFRYSAWDEDAERYGNDGYYDLESGFLLPPIYYNLWPGELLTVENWTEDGLRYGFIRRDTGEVVFPLEFDGLYDEVGCSEGYVLAAYELGMQGDGTVWGPDYHLYTMEGEEILFPEGVEPWSGVRNGALILEHVLTHEERLEHTTGWGQVYGLGRPDGTVLVDLQYDYIDYAGEGLYSIMLDELCGVMDADGNVIVPPIYDIDTGGPPPAIYFNGCGYTVIDDERTDRHILMNREGKELFSVPYSRTDPETGETRYYDILSPAENGCFWVYSYTVSKSGNYRTEDHQYTLMRVDGDRVDTLTEQVFDNVFDGVKEASCGQQDEAFAEGIQAVCRDGLWGYIDENGLVAIDFQWDAAANFYHGLALVEKDGKLGYIDHDGAAVWREK